MTGISVCMVVRDEQDFIKGAIDSCLPYLKIGDELVVIDGGSIDDTMSVLDEYGDKIRVVVLPQLWDKREWKDEAAYRNLCFEQCQNDWILSHDADEAYPKIVYDIMHELVDNPKKIAYYFPTVNFYGSTKQMIDPLEFPDFHIRLVNRKHFSWVGKIHSSLWHYGGRPISPMVSFVGTLAYPLYHYARVNGDVDRKYGEVPKKIVSFNYPHPRPEFDTVE